MIHTPPHIQGTITGRLSVYEPAAIPVVISPMLPIYPSPGTDARRIVRHGLADVLEWLGQEVGPEPGVPTHAYLSTDPAHGGGTTVIMSQEYHDALLNKERQYWAEQFAPWRWQR